MDVWFDSGSSHAAVLERREELQWPADLYLEGSDQYRGWFNSSLITGVAVKGKAPYKGILKPRLYAGWRRTENVQVARQYDRSESGVR